MRKRRPDRNFGPSLALSVALHALVLPRAWAWFDMPPPPPEQRVLAVSVQTAPVEELADPGGEEAAPEPAGSPPPSPRAAKPSPPSAPVAPVAEVGAREGTAPLPVPASPAPRPPATSFSSWRSNRLGRYASSIGRGGTWGAPGGTADGTDGVSSRGRDRCEPTGRSASTVFLLFDSSGSMDSIRRRQALTCAHQYAKYALDRGARVIVGNFAGTTTFSEPTRSLTDVEFSLRGGSNPNATVLPSKELNPFLDADPGGVADLIIVSDAYIPNYRETLPWYKYFLRLNPENRGMLFTVGTSGHPDVVRAFQQIGFEVVNYHTL